MSVSFKDRFKTLWDIRHGLLNRRNVILLLMISLLATIAFMNIGASVNDEYNAQEENAEIQQRPSELNLPTEEGGIFNFSNGFSNFPEFSPPSGFFDPDRFDPEIWGGGWNISGINGEFSFPGVSIPTFSFPTFPTFSWDPITFEPFTITPPTVNPPPTVQPPISEPGVLNETENDPFNFSLPERDNKARYLPQINLFQNSSFEISLPTLQSLKLGINLTFEGVLFVLLLFSILYLNKKFLPELISQLEAGDQDTLEETQPSTFFVNKPKNLENERIQKRRLRQLLIFKDHVDELVNKSKKRIVEKGADHTIITGYYDLDEAFSEFAKLTRTKDITPLEHATRSFETGEIDNEKLEEIVNLFYYARFGHRAMTIEDGWEFIDHLANLVNKKLEEKGVEEE